MEELTLMVFLHNFRTRSTGINQTTTVYSDDYMGTHRTRNFRNPVLADLMEPTL